MEILSKQKGLSTNTEMYACLMACNSVESLQSRLIILSKTNTKFSILIIITKFRTPAS